jgi:prepilin-type processing-associated H-X9-DG protein
MARTDYAACGGDQYTPEIDGGPGFGTASDPYAVADGRSGNYIWFPSPHNGTDYSLANGRYGPNGVVYRRSKVSLPELTAGKGSSNQYLIGEKFLRTDKYGDSLRLGGGADSDGGDNENMYCGHDNDVERVTYYAPAKDHPPPFSFVDAASKGNNETFRFGSTHASGFNMMMADGSVSHISFSINPDVFRQGGNRFSGAVGSFTGN